VLKVNSKNLALRIFEYASKPGLDTEQATNLLGLVAAGWNRNEALQRQATEQALTLALLPETSSYCRTNLFDLIRDCTATSPTTAMRVALYTYPAARQTELFNQLTATTTGFVAALATSEPEQRAKPARTRKPAKPAARVAPKPPIA
jgi:hypothetical protein